MRSRPAWYEFWSFFNASGELSRTGATTRLDCFTGLSRLMAATEVVTEGSFGGPGDLAGADASGRGGSFAASPFATSPFATSPSGRGHSEMGAALRYASPSSTAA